MQLATLGCFERAAPSLHSVNWSKSEHACVHVLKVLPRAAETARMLGIDVSDAQHLPQSSLKFSDVFEL